ncbi:hypothetical protein Hanom_Chr01g00020821 [Helianthus anomalus]
MERGDLELGQVDSIGQETMQSLLDCVEDEENHTNPFSSSMHIAPGILVN